ncbi:hypothetical protein GCM10027447_02930 [Glycomyces halotolerans]
MPSPQRQRAILAAVLLACAAIVIAVAVSQWQFGAGLDPRDDSLRRAAGMGFTDEARRTLFSVVPVAAPLLAAWLCPGRVIRRLARVLYVVYLVIGVLLALSAAKYGFDEATQLAAEGQVFIDARAAVERLLLDGVWLILAGAGWFAVRWNRVCEKTSTVTGQKPEPPKE